MSKSLADLVRRALQSVDEILPESALQIIEKPDRAGWHFVDVREPDEYAGGHIPGARSFPRGFLEVRADLEHKKRDPWLEDRDRKLILYCGGGHRSALAALSLKEMGFRRVLSLAGGWTRWTELEFPTEL
jgi:rhodanese-related sulfurtransferase